MQWAIVIVIVLLAGIGYELEKISTTLREIRDRLEQVENNASELRVSLCGDPRVERMIKETNEVGANLTDEELAYKPGILASISDKLDTINNGVWQIVK